MSLIKGWTRFELVWLAFFTTANIIPFVLSGFEPLSFISAMAGMLCVVLVAKGKISNYFFGLIQVLTYSYISYQYRLYGEVMLNMLFYLPVQFIGFYLWSKNRVVGVASDISSRRLKVWQTALLAVVLLVIASAYSVFLRSIGGSSTGLDAFTTVFSIGAQVLMLMRFTEQWLAWIIVNIASIALWFITLSQGTGTADYSILVMWFAFLVNSIYGYWNWLRLSRI